MVNNSSASRRPKPQDGIFSQRTAAMNASTLILCLLLFQIGPLFAHYLRDDFSNNANGWVSNFCYSRTGVVWPQVNFTTAIRITNGVLSNGGTPNSSAAGDRNGFWKGLMSYNTNLYHASAENPFGWEIIRTNSVVNPRGTYTPSDARLQAEQSLWLFVWKPGLTGTNEWDVHDQFINLYDFSGDYGSPITNSNHIGCFDGVARPFDMLNSSGPMGNTYNLSNLVLWNYNWNGSRTNTNAIGFRMTHNGSTISFFANPDPYDRNALHPNEWFLLGTRDVLWNSNFQVMLGTEGRIGQVNQVVAAQYKDFLIRSATSGVGFYAEPFEFNHSRRMVRVTLILSNDLKPYPENAGVNLVRLVRPKNFRFDPEGLSGLSMRVHWGAPGREYEARRVPFLQTRCPQPGEVTVLPQFLPDELRLLLGAPLAARPEGGTEWIKIILEMKQDGEAGPEQFPAVFVMAEQFDFMPMEGRNRYSTCGWESAPFKGYWPNPAPMARVDLR